MKQYLALMFLLGSNFATYTMSFGIFSNCSSKIYESYDEENPLLIEENEVENLVHTLNQYVNESNIHTMKTFLNMFGGSEIRFTPAICSTIQDNIDIICFPQLIDVSEKCKKILGENTDAPEGDNYSDSWLRSVGEYILKQPYFADEFDKGINTLKYGMNEIHVLFGDILHSINNQLEYSARWFMGVKEVCTYIEKKSYSAFQLVTMLNMVNYLEMESIVSEVLLRNLLKCLAILSRDREYQTRDSVLQSLNVVYHDKLKSLLITVWVYHESVKSGVAFKNVLKEAEPYRTYSLQKAWDVIG